MEDGRALTAQPPLPSFSLIVILIKRWQVGGRNSIVSTTMVANKDFETLREPHSRAQSQSGAKHGLEPPESSTQGTPTQFLAPFP